MRYRNVLVVVAVVLAGACRGDDDADSAMVPGQPPTLRQLATAWSGGRTQPRCQDRGPRGEYLGPAGQQYCVWSGAEEAQGEVSTNMGARGRVMLLQWNRQTAGAADADRLVDSLSRALTSHGLRARACPSGDVPAGHLELRQWEAPTLIVQLARIAPPQGAPRLMVLATDMPPMPDIMCPRSDAA